MTVRLCRPPESKRLPLELRGLDADGVFTGYASLFGEADLARDIVEPGAFAASLARRGVRGVKMLWHHDPAEPIGTWLDIREDRRGLAVSGQILTDLSRGREALVLMRAGAVDGLSIGFRTVRARPEPAVAATGGRKTAGRRLIEVDLWEISLVTFPMLPAARVAAVKGEFGARVGAARSEHAVHGAAFRRAVTPPSAGEAADLAARIRRAARQLAPT